MILAYDLWTSLGIGVEEHRVALEEGRTGLELDDSFGDPMFVGRIRELPPLPCGRDGYDSRAARILARLAERVRPHLVDAGIHPGRIGVVVGTSTGGLDRTEDFLRGHIDRTEFDVERQHATAALAESLAHEVGARGPRVAVSTACTSGAKAFAVARRWLDLGLVDRVLVGGADGLCRTTVRGFHSLGVMSEGPCHPFAAVPTGMSVAEGGAVFVLAREGDGRARLVGYGESSDAHHLASPDPDGQGAELAIRACLRDATLDRVDHVNAHGTGTRNNDQAESRAIGRVFGPDVPVTSTKGATGHLLGAAASVEAAFALMALEDGSIPPTLGGDRGTYSDRIDLVTEPRRMRVRSVISTSLAFGGNNATLAFAREELS